MPIKRAMVVGAGTMGAGIAAHLANAGVPVWLLDVVPSALTPDDERRGRAFTHPAVRNRLALEAVERLKTGRPPAFFSPASIPLITPGNLEDHLHLAGEADWIIEAITENLAAKRDLLGRLEKVCRPDAIVSTNTSGLPVTAIAKHVSSELRARVLGTHFFNPPRYMRLLELIPTNDTSPDVVRRIHEFAEKRLGKGVAICKDTPNFVGNRYAAMTGAMLIDFVLAHGYTVEEVDTITGPLIGRPKTATFRLLDLVGIDIAAMVNQNLYALIPQDESRETLRSPRLVDLFSKMIERGLVGDKVKQGFYRRLPKQSGGAIQSLDLNTLEYRDRREPQIPSLAEAARKRSVVDRFAFLLEQDDKAGALVRHVRQGFAYTARRVPEICDDYPTVDRVIRWGFGHELGPFEMWNGLGVRRTAEALEREGVAIGPWVTALLASGHEHFYEPAGESVSYFDVTSRAMTVAPSDGRIALDRLHRAGRAVRENRSASLVDLGDGVLCLEVHSKLNTLDDDVLAMIDAGIEALAGPWEGLVVGNDGQDFGVGANIARLLEVGASAGNPMVIIERTVKDFQDAMQALRFSERPVVVAPFGRTLGGCCELVLAGSRVVALAETYVGLVEIGVGLIPGAGGCKEMVRRTVSPAMRAAGVDPLPLLQHALQTLGLAKVSSSADEARSFGFLTTGDTIVMNRDLLLTSAKRAVLDLAGAGYRPPARGRTCYAAGRAALATLKAGLYLMEQGGYATAYDRHVASKIAHVLCGGDLTSPQWVDEQYFLDLEREAFVSLCGEPKTQQRIQYMLKEGKPLRN